MQINACRNPALSSKVTTPAPPFSLIGQASPSPSALKVIKATMLRGKEAEEQTAKANYKSLQDKLEAETKYWGTKTKQDEDQAIIIANEVSKSSSRTGRKRALS